RSRPGAGPSPRVTKAMTNAVDRFREGSLRETGPCGGLEGAASAKIPDRRADLAVAFRASSDQNLDCDHWLDTVVGTGASSTSRTFCVSARGVNGFCRKGVPSTSTP